MEHILESVGLAKHERTIYLSLLKMGHATVAELSRATSLHRPTIYQWLPRLTSMGLVGSYLKGKTKLFYAESPEHLRKLLLWKQEELDETLPELTELYERHRQKPAVRYFEGEDIVTVIYDDVLASCKKGDVFYRYESPSDYKKFDEWLPSKYFTRICKNKEIDKFVITNEKTASTKKKVLERIERVVPKDFDPFVYDITQIIYANKVAFIDFESRVAWIIENKRFAAFQRQLFKLLFRQLPRG